MSQAPNQQHKSFAKTLGQILPRNKRSMFGTLEVYPHEVRFATQNKGERIFIKTRSHFIINIGWLFNTLFFGLVPLISTVGLNLVKIVFNSIGLVDLSIFLSEIEDLIYTIPFTVWLMLALTYYTFLMSFALIKFLNWYFNIYLVTNERVLHMTYTAFTGKRVAETSLENIEDISQKTIGFLPAIFNFGDIRIQTAAKKGQFLLRHVPDPSWFRDVISDLAKLVESHEP